MDTQIFLFFNKIILEIKLAFKAIKNLVLDNQEKIVNAAKLAMKPFYLSNKVSKEDYKAVMKKVVTKVRNQFKCL